MIPTTTSITAIRNKLKAYGVQTCIKASLFSITVQDLKDFTKISPLIYMTLNKFETAYQIFIHGVPFCLMPDATPHLIHTPLNKSAYIKDTVCKTCKYFDNCPGWYDGKAPSPRPPAIADLPHELVFEVTTKCNLNCPLCFSIKKNEDLSLDKIKKLIDACQRFRIKNVRFTGGEPLLYKKLEPALAYAKSQHLYVTVNTNATLLTSQTENILRKYADDLLISLQGFDPTSDQKATQGTYDFKKKLHNIVKLRSHVPIVRIGTIISQTLINNFAKYSHLIRSLGVSKWGLFRPMYITPDKEFRLTRKDFLRIMTHIKTQRVQGFDIMLSNTLPFCVSPDINLSHHVLAGGESDDGHNRLVVDIKGYLKPSYCIDQNLGESIMSAWKSSFLLKLRSLDYLSPQCQNCASLRWCKGGSRHWAKIVFNDYFAADPLMNKKSRSEDRL